MTIPFRNTIIAVVAISLFTFIALFGRLPALRKTPIGFTYRIICIHTPNGFHRLDSRYTNGRLAHSLDRLTTYLLYKKNPIILIFFLGLLTGSTALFLTSALPHLTTPQTLPIPILVAFPYIFTYLCATRTSAITTSNHTRLNTQYPHDHILYRPHTICRTCNFEKPARSKHCSLCGVCVSKCDHHCPWVNNCLGQHNYRYFLLLLLSLGLVISYGAWLAWRILSPHLHVSPGLSWFESRFWGEVVQGLVFAVNIGGLGIAGVGMLATTTAPLPFALLAYHGYLVWAGMTTNESAKWADWRDDMYDGFVWKGKRSVVDAHNRAREARHGRPPAEEEVVVPWPIQSDQIVLRTTDGKPPSGQEQLWERCTGLEMVDNIYDLGFWRNFVDVVKGR